MDLLGRFTIHHDRIAINQKDYAKWSAQSKHNDVIICILPENFQEDVYKNSNHQLESVG